MHSSNLGVNTSHVFSLRVNCTLRVCMKWSYLYLVFKVKFSQWPHYSLGVFKTNEAKCTITTYANYTKVPTAVVHEDPASSQLTGRLHGYGFSKPRENFALCTPLVPMQSSHTKLKSKNAFDANVNDVFLSEPWTKNTAHFRRHICDTDPHTSTATLLARTA